MKIASLLAALVLTFLSFDTQAQTRFIYNYSVCNHMVAVEWVDPFCGPAGVGQYAVAPGAMMMIVGPGGPFSTFFQMNHVEVDNMGGGSVVVSSPFCPGPPDVISIPPTGCGHMVVINPGANITIN
ncbi:MAG: hypothetical protein ACFB10_00245 [Salibacteraceae bacterium]